MNNKQLIFMWLGIVAIAFPAFITIADAYRPNYSNFVIWAFLVALIASGLIYTCRDKKRQENERTRELNLKKGFRRITFVLAVCAAIICGAIAVFVPISKKSHATSMWWIDDLPVVKKPTEQELTEFKKWQQEALAKRIISEPNYYSIDKYDLSDLGGEVVYSPQDNQLPSLDELKPILIEREQVKFWVSLSKGSLIGLCILVGLSGVVIGFSGVWIFYLLIFLVYLIIKWIIRGFMK